MGTPRPLRAPDRAMPIAGAGPFRITSVTEVTDRPALVAAQLEAALSMGWHRILVNIINSNHESIRIFEAAGFRYIERFAECSDPVEVDPWFVYMQRDLS